MSRILTSAVVIGVMALASPVAAERPRTTTVSKRYVSGDPGPLLGGTSVCGAAWDSVGMPSMGAVCLGETSGRSVTLRIEDESGLPVGGVMTITDGEGTVLESRPFCGSSSPIAVVPGIMFVFLDSATDVHGLHWHEGPGCHVLGVWAGVGATRGVLRATFVHG